jgi:hypothetical protein
MTTEEKSPARVAIEAIVACVETYDIDGVDLVALEDARAVLDQFDIY